MSNGASKENEQKLDVVVLNKNHESQSYPKPLATMITCGA